MLKVVNLDLTMSIDCRGCGSFQVNYNITMSNLFGVLNQLRMAGDMNRYEHISGSGRTIFCGTKANLNDLRMV